VDAFIEIENLHYRPDSFPQDKPDILDGITFDIPEGGFYAIIGENGSGKTTLLKQINGLLFPSQGSVRVDGIDTQNRETRNTLQSLVGMVFQNPSDQIVASTIEEDVAFGLENLNIPTSEIRARVSHHLKSVGLYDDANRPPHLLSGGEMQRLALAGVLARQPNVILFDEPTSMLDPRTRHALMQQIRDLHKKGMTIVYVTHHMEEAVYADRVIILHQGKLKANGKPADVFKNQQLLYETGLEIPDVVRLANLFRSLGWQVPDDVLTPDDLVTLIPQYDGKQKTKTSENGIGAGQIIIDVNDVHYTYLSDTPFAKSALQSASVEFNGQQIHGLAGTNGSGKSTLLQHLNGILRPSLGEILVDGLRVHLPETRLVDVIKKVGLVFQNPESQFFEVFVGDEIAYGPKQFQMEGIRDRVRDAMEMVGLDFENFKDRRLETLSGGEKRKVALASTLVLDQKILLFDEPTAGMDPQAREDLLKLFISLNQQGKTLIIATHRLEELAQISNSLSLMQSGKILTSGKSEEIFSEIDHIRKSGLIEPLAVQISEKLQEKGWPIEIQNNITTDQLIHSLQELNS
jgi:energy-coupling factor transport system ATP-binding protein